MDQIFSYKIGIGVSDARISSHGQADSRPTTGLVCNMATVPTASICQRETALSRSSLQDHHGYGLEVVHLCSELRVFSTALSDTDASAVPSSDWLGHRIYSMA
jgi:hypothetical protein